MYEAFLECFLDGMQNVADPGLNWWERVTIRYWTMFGERLAL